MPGWGGGGVGHEDFCLCLLFLYLEEQGHVLLLFCASHVRELDEIFKCSTPGKEERGSSYMLKHQGCSFIHEFKQMTAVVGPL